MFELLFLINSVRVQPLQIDPILTEKAEQRAEYLCEKNQWSHDGWRDQFSDLGYVHYGENLAKGFRKEAKAHKAFMKSPSHKRNILNPTYTKLGIGKKNCKGKIIMVELFAG